MSKDIEEGICLHCHIVRGVKVRLIWKQITSLTGKFECPKCGAHTQNFIMTPLGD